jgi:lipoate-protein ligase A
MNSKTGWRLLVLKDLDPISVQTIWHAIALAMSDKSDPNVILLTTTNRVSMCCGYHQNFYEEVDLEYCKRNNIQLVRRLAGGGLVLLDRNQVFFNVVMNGYGFPSPIKKLYSIALKGPALFLKRLQLDSRINFNEIAISDRKISGTGAASIENAGIVIGNILLDFDYERFCNALNVPSAQFRQLLIEQLPNHLTNLSSEVENVPSIDQTIEGLKFSFESALGTDLIEDDVSESEQKTLDDLLREYNRKEWNFRNDDPTKTIRSYIKIKKGTCIVHYTPLTTEFFISNGFIYDIRPIPRKEYIRQLLGKNIEEISNQDPSYMDLQKELMRAYEYSKT